MSAEATQPIRTWTLRGWYHGEENERDYVSVGPRIGPDGPVEVIELEPVLDLLGRLRLLAASGAITTDGDVAALEAQEALLREHGRLR